jgi:hypothetical protein
MAPWAIYRVRVRPGFDLDATARGLVPEEWVFEDEGHSGATLIRPALERLRDTVAGVGVDVVLCDSPDRLAREFAYQTVRPGSAATRRSSVWSVSPSGSAPRAARSLPDRGVGSRSPPGSRCGRAGRPRRRQWRDPRRHRR